MRAQISLPTRIVHPRPLKLCHIDVFTPDLEMISDVLPASQICWCVPPDHLVVKASYRDAFEVVKYEPHADVVLSPFVESHPVCSLPDTLEARWRTHVTGAGR